MFERLTAFAILPCLTLALANTYGQTADLEEALEQARREAGLPAMWAARYEIESDTGALIVSTQAVAGVRKFGEDEPASFDDTIHLGSCTKAMTACLIAQLVSQGKLNWETSLASIFPESKEIQSGPWAEATVRELLEHQSGAPANAPWTKIDQAHPSDVVAARRQVLAWLAVQSRPTKRAFLYSNVGYCVLGHIVEQIEGRAWERVIEEQLFQPLQMQSCGFGPVKGQKPLDQPWGHVKRPGGEDLLPLRIDNAAPLGPAGRCHMPIRDWAKFVHLAASANIKGEFPELSIANETWKQLLKPTSQLAAEQYAGGWNVVQRSWASGTAFNHAGSNTTWYCVAWVAPKKDFFVLIATNAYTEAAPNACDRVAAMLVTQ